MFAGSHPRLLAGLIFCALLAVACLWDVRRRRIPNKLVLAITAAGLCFSVVSMPPLSGFAHGVAGLAIGLALWTPSYLMRYVGAGDVKLFGAIGAWLGPASTVEAALFAALAGGLLAVATMLHERGLRGGLASLGLWVASLPISAGPDSAAPMPRSYIPYGLALGAGAAIAAWLPGLIL